MPTQEEITVWRGIAERYLTEYGLTQQGWRFDINRRKRAVGLCSYRDKTIYLSEYYLDSEPAELINTVLHEVAHAIVGPEFGHGPVWQSVARSIGCTGDRCANSAQYSGEYNYRLYCPNDCGREWFRNRLNGRIRTGRCPACKVTIAIESLR